MTMKAHTTLAIPLAALITISVIPTTLHAETAMDACIKAFVEERLPKDRAIKVRKLGSSSAVSSSSHEGRIKLKANGAKSGTEIASATCVVTQGGVSIAMYEEKSRSTLASNAADKTGA
jgi:hypothetical protein